jgi:hypothetical protein
MKFTAAAAALAADANVQLLLIMRMYYLCIAGHLSEVQHPHRSL